MGKKALIKIGDYFIVTGWNGDPPHLGEQLLNITFNETFPFLQTVIGATRNFAVISISKNLRKTDARKKTLSSYDLENVVDFSEYDCDVDYVYEIDYPVVAVENKLPKGAIRYANVSATWPEHKQDIFKHKIEWKTLEGS